jgi:hypothetical protein
VDTALRTRDTHPTSSNSTFRLLKDLPIIPHWDIGFSGPNGLKLKSVLTKWNTAVRMISNDLNKVLVHNVTTVSDMKPRGKIIVGFISSWFCNSAVGRLMLGLINTLERDKFSIVLFHLSGLSGQVPPPRNLSWVVDIMWACVC